MIRPDENFTEKLINLYAEFYNSDMEFISPLKTILRPNNVLILFILIISIDIHYRGFNQKPY